MTEHLLIFFAGLAGSMHCIGMCGGFACALGADPRGRAASWLRHLAYNTGRVATYCFIGAVVGQLGVLLVGHDGETSAAAWAQRGLAMLAGALMIGIGAHFVAPRGRGGDPLRAFGGERLARALRGVLRAPGAAAPLAFGALNGLLPCPLVYALAMQAAASGSALGGVLVMAAFGLGTFAAMLAMGGVGLWWRGRGAAARDGHAARVDVLPAGSGAAAPQWRARGVRVAAGLIVLLGAITLARGLLPLGAHLH